MIGSHRSQKLRLPVRLLVIILGVVVCTIPLAAQGAPGHTTLVSSGPPALLDAGGWPSPTPTITPEPTLPPAPTPTTEPLESIFATETATPVVPYPLEGFLDEVDAAQAQGLEPVESQPRSPNLLLLSLPFAAAAVILAAIVLNWVRRSRG